MEIKKICKECGTISGHQIWCKEVDQTISESDSSEGYIKVHTKLE